MSGDDWPPEFAPGYRVLKSDQRPPQSDMFADQLPIIKHALPDATKTTQQNFEDFHRLNPHLYVRLARMAKDLVRAGRKRIGMAMLIEVVRWDYLTTTDHGEHDFKINNNYQGRYARLLMENEPELAGLFELRKLRTP